MCQVYRNNFKCKHVCVWLFSRLCDEDEEAAAVDVVECTREPTAYDHPINTNIKFWDLPGIGTPEYPDLETYCEKVQLEKYHTFLIFTATRFTKNNMELAKKVRSIDKNFFFIRTHIDETVRAERRKRSFDEDAMLTKIRRDCLESLGGLLSNEQDVFLISNHKPENWEFTRLTAAILDVVKRCQREALTRNQRESMILSLGKVVTRSLNETFQRKVDVLRGRIWKVASLSGAAAAIPLLGLSFAVDTGLVLKELIFYMTQLGLPETGFLEFAKLRLPTKEKVLHNGRTIGAQLKGVVGPYIAEAAVEEFTRYVPVVGLVIASGMSFAATYFALSKFLTSVEETAKLILKEAAAKISANLELGRD